MRKSNRRGMTFLEIMSVVVIIGVLLAVAIPNMAGPRERTLLRQTVRDLAAAGFLARQTAMSQGNPTYLYIGEKTGEWQLSLMPNLEEDSRRRRDFRDGEPTMAEEIPRTLHHLVSFAKVEVEYEHMDKDDRHVLTFYPNGTSSGMAVMVKNTRDRALTVDFDRLTGRPEVYEGAPKTFAQKLKENGIDPELYGLEDPELAGLPKRQAGEGFKRTAGMNEEQRVQHYKDAVERMMSRGRTRYMSAGEGGAAAYYAQEAARWGKR